MADERGSIVSVTNASGAVIGINSYDAYGVPASGNIGRFQYTGQIWLAEIGLFYYKARMYAPSLGRFMQADPVGYADGMNWYAYVGGDPVNFVDPLGLNFCSPRSGGERGCFYRTDPSPPQFDSGDIVVTGSRPPDHGICNACRTSGILDNNPGLVFGNGPGRWRR
jgi:RHS repeat-associated protein